MREYLNKEDTVSFCKALSSELRVDMLQCIYKNKGISLNDLAVAMGVTRAAITQNMKILSKADLVEVKQVHGQKEARKVCYLKENNFSISLGEHFDSDNIYFAEMPIGQFTSYKVQPTCGIATASKMIGVLDDPRYFDDPERVKASILWLNSGYVEYRLPNYLQDGQYPTEIQMSMEISSEAPGYCNNWPSDISFYLNDTLLGSWTSPGDFGDIRGLYTPDWWAPNLNQYGLLILLTVNRMGSFVDGIMISPVTLQSLGLNKNSEFRFRIAAPSNAVHAGGMTLFGHGFGNYNQDIKLHVIYDTVPPAKEEEAAVERKQK
ncbi:MAG: helix-turn-helix domain-containing protein [Oscillospiraceae bacterium]|jgi:predicted transcriptional regulator|nr:helix-turn-helix domain-containing protein [Oscillospiraceae bacterium]MDD3260499.1 helix-turn-helix domain-containing protein [Oscillospiraceae bacterium]